MRPPPWATSGVTRSAPAGRKSSALSAGVEGVWRHRGGVPCVAIRMSGTVPQLETFCECGPKFNIVLKVCWKTCFELIILHCEVHHVQIAFVSIAGGWPTACSPMSVSNGAEVELEEEVMS